MAQQKQEELKRQKDIGQFFTPQEVVNFIYDMLTVHLDKEEKWKKGKFPSIIDPACGEGVFLKVALDKEITKPIYVFGVDLDEKVKEKWIEINLLKSFGSKAELDIHFYHQNGLLPLPEKTLRYKRGGLNQYDLVVGNPPYGGVGLQVITRQLHDTLLKYEIWRRASKQNSNKQNDNAFLFEEMPENLSKDQEERLKKFPIEILFAERFIQLCKPGGHIAIIIPDGILSNSNLHYAREFISEKMKVNAIVSLPRETFKGAGTSAKTSILFMTKQKEEEKKADDYKIFLASVEKLENIDKIYEYYKEVNQMNSSKKDLVKVINDSQGNEVAMVRVDRTLKEMMGEKPSSRWNPEYWHPKFTIAEDTFISIKVSVKNVSDFEEFITYGPIVVGKEFKNEKDGVILINQTEIGFTGLDFSKALRAKKDSPWVIERAKPKNNDLLLARSGVGGVGKNKITIFNKNIEACVGCFVDILRLKDINPFYVLVFWKGIYGWSQINKIINGVGTVNISFDEIRSIKIPIIADKVQKNIESEYKKMSIYHDRAMETKAKGDEQGYKKNIGTAEKMLKELVARTEAVIREEKEDVI